MILRAMRGILDRVRWQPARHGGCQVERSSRARDAAGSATQADALPGASPSGSSLGTKDAESVKTQVDLEEVDRLVDLTFVALLRRKPERDTLLAYRESFANGTTFRDLIDDVIRSEEYRTVQQRAQLRRAALAQTPRAALNLEEDDLPTTVALLTTCLIDKGWRPQSGPIADIDRYEVDGDGRRLRSLRVTLSVLDQL